VISLKDSTTTTKKAKEYPQDPILFFLIPFETLKLQKRHPILLQIIKTSKFVFSQYHHPTTEETDFFISSSFAKIVHSSDGKKRQKRSR